MTEPKDCAREHPMSDYCGTHGTRLETCARLDALAASKDAALAALRERLAAAEKRAETAEALVRELAAALRGARDAAQSHEWDTFRTNSDGYPISDERMCSTCGAFAQDGWDHENDCAFAKGLVDLSPAARKEIEG